MKKYVLSVLISLTLMSFVPAETINVNVVDYAFTPADIVCGIGDTVVWTYDSLALAPHTTTSTSVPAGASTWDYTFAGPGDTYTYVIEVTGDYTYQCNYHPAMMQGTIRAGYSLPMVENFEYPEGDTLRNYGGWKNHSGTGTFIMMTPGSLDYPGYPASGIGNSVTLAGGSGSREDVNKLFHQQSQGAVYAAFLVNVTSASATGDYFFHFAPYFPTTTFRGRVFVMDDGADNVLFGLSFGSGTPVYTSTSYFYGVTNLLVLKYEYVNDATGSDDIVKLYINPVLTDPEPASPDLQGTDTNTDIMVGAVALRQGGNVYTVQVDGIKVGTLWNDVVPVELTSFNAFVNNNSVTLSWKTSTETNNRGFEIQRKTSNTEWTDISFINGNGTSTQSHEYSYVDGNLEAGNYSYRLKQVDFNGAYEYSKVVEAGVNTPVKFELAQNYPNPFNPATRIDFTVPSNGNVKLTVYNVLGQEIKTLVNGFMKSGNHTIDFNAANLNSGLYFYRLESNGVSQVKKMMLIK